MLAIAFYILTERQKFMGYMYSKRWQSNTIIQCTIDKMCNL